MSRQDVEHFQSFCRKWINRTVREHFRDLPVATDDPIVVPLSKRVNDNTTAKKGLAPVLVRKARG